MVPSRMLGTDPHVLGVGGDANRVGHLHHGLMNNGQENSLNFEQLSLIQKNSAKKDYITKNREDGDPRIKELLREEYQIRSKGETPSQEFKERKKKLMKEDFERR